jgi:hypothetical protein
MTVVTFEPFVPIDALVAPRQRFQCMPLAAVLNAGTCVLKQRKALVSDEPGVKPPPCLDCADGRRVQARIDSSLRELRDLRGETAEIASTTKSTESTKGESQEERIVEASTPANTNGTARCAEPGCEMPAGSVRKNTPPECAGYCMVHRKKKMDHNRFSKEGRAAKAARNASERPKSLPGPKTVAPPVDLTTPSVLAELHAVCVDAGQHRLAVIVGTALAASVRGGKS